MQAVRHDPCLHKAFLSSFLFGHEKSRPIQSWKCCPNAQQNTNLVCQMAGPVTNQSPKNTHCRGSSLYVPEPRFSLIQLAINYHDYKIVTSCTSLDIHVFQVLRYISTPWHAWMHPSIHPPIHPHLCTFCTYMCLSLHYIVIHTLCILNMYVHVHKVASLSPFLPSFLPSFLSFFLSFSISL